MQKLNAIFLGFSALGFGVRKTQRTILLFSLPSTLYSTGTPNSLLFLHHCLPKRFFALSVEVLFFLFKDIPLQQMNNDPCHSLKALSDSFCMVFDIRKVLQLFRNFCELLLIAELSICSNIKTCNRKINVAFT